MKIVVSILLSSLLMLPVKAQPLDPNSTSAQCLERVRTKMYAEFPKQMDDARQSLRKAIDDPMIPYRTMTPAHKVVAKRDFAKFRAYCVLAEALLYEGRNSDEKSCSN